MSDDHVAGPDDANPAVDAAPRSDRRRFQFSIARLLALTTIVAILAAIWASYRLELWQSERDLQTARHEIEIYREEHGCLNLNVAPTKIHSRALPHRNANRWERRFYLPEGRQYRLAMSTGTISEDDFPAPDGRSTRTLSPGEYVFCAYAESASSGKWRLHSEVFDRGMFRGGRGYMDVDIPALDQGCDTDPADLCTIEATVAPNERLQLLRCRIADDAETSSNDAAGRSKGFVIWIEEAK
jgi:hypothetical protein